MAVTKRTRYEVLNRDAFTCRYCHATDVPLTVDHVVPVSLGGTDTPDNLVAACKDCNSGKGSSNPDGATVAAVSDDAVRWARAQKHIQQEREADLAQKDQLLDMFEQAFYVHCEEAGKHWAYPDRSWRQSVSTFMDAGLTGNDFNYFLKVAANAKIANGAVWRYFCGCCWSEIKKRQDMARDLLDVEDQFRRETSDEET